MVEKHYGGSKAIPLHTNVCSILVQTIKNNFVLYYGSEFERKGPELLIESMKEVFKKYKEWKLIMVLRHDVSDRYKKRVRGLGIEKNVLFIGREVENIEDYVNAADIVVLPYKDMISTEGNPSYLLEAMACKTPVVTTDLPELREIAEPGKDILMAKPGDEQSLAKEVNRLLLDKKLQKRLAENAYKKSKEFDVKLIAKRFIRLYQGMLHGR